MIIMDVEARIHLDEIYSQLDETDKWELLDLLMIDLKKPGPDWDSFLKDYELKEIED